MLLPNGQHANKIERVMLLSMWTKSLKEDALSMDISVPKSIISAGIGKPTYPINKHTVESYLNYWKKIDEVSSRWRQDPDKLHENSAVNYGDPRGDKIPLEIMSKCMSDWYDVPISKHHILFTVGGIGGLRIIFETLNTHFDDLSKYRVITPFPYYSAYSNNPSHLLHPINVMDEPGYRLTAKAMEESIQKAYELAEADNMPPKAVLICNPSNPLGNLIKGDELHKIADVLRKYPDLYVIFDEAYIEMCFVQPESLLTIAPDLKERLIILRSATKSLSAAGERMAILITFDDMLMKEMVNKSISYFIHSPRSAQLAYAETMTKFDDEYRIDMSNFYKRKVDYVIKRLEDMGASMPDEKYQVEATFYAMGDFSDLFGLEMPKSVEKVFERSGQIKTDEELAYYLLFQEGLMIAPMSYFGLAENSGLIRITCSAHQTELTEMMNRLEHCLYHARKNKHQELIQLVKNELLELKQYEKEVYDSLDAKVSQYAEPSSSTRELKQKNDSLIKAHKVIKNLLYLHSV